MITKKNNMHVFSNSTVVSKKTVVCRSDWREKEFTQLLRRKETFFSGLKLEAHLKDVSKSIYNDNGRCKREVIK